MKYFNQIGSLLGIDLGGSKEKKFDHSLALQVNEAVDRLQNGGMQGINLMNENNPNSRLIMSGARIIETYPGGYRAKAGPTFSVTRDETGFEVTLENSLKDPEKDSRDTVSQHVNTLESATQLIIAYGERTKRLLDEASDPDRKRE